MGAFSLISNLQRGVATAAVIKKEYTDVIESYLEFHRVTHGTDKVKPSNSTHFDFAAELPRTKFHKLCNLLKADTNADFVEPVSSFSKSSEMRFNKCETHRFCGVRVIGSGAKY